MDVICEKRPFVCLFHKTSLKLWAIFLKELLRELLAQTRPAAEDLMPGDIMSSEPRHWMVFGQLVMAVQSCAEAPAAAVPQHSTAQA